MKRILLSLIIGLTPMLMSAQRLPSALVQISYNTFMPVNNNFVEEFSWTGFGFAYQTEVKDNLFSGFSISFETVREYQERQTYIFDNPNFSGAINTDLYKFIHNVPITWKTDYYIAVDKTSFFYTSIGIGAMYSDYSIVFSQYELIDRGWGFLVNPRVGMMFAASKTSYSFINLGVGYSFSSNGSEFFDVDNQHFLNFYLGLTLEP